MSKHPAKYLAVFTLPILAYVSFNSYGWMTFLPIMEAFVLIPLLELLIKPDASNLAEETEKEIARSRVYDYFVYGIVPIQFFLLGTFLLSMNDPNLTTVDIIGRLSAMGLMCGVYGINVAHELGHRSKGYEQTMSKLLLMTSMYMHFFIEHNRGHHKRVSTHEDPSSARYGESLYSFWFRSTVFSYLSAWRLERKRLAKKGISTFSFHNEMLRFQLIQLAFLTTIWYFFGPITMLYFLGAATMGFLLLETVNYIEHYGLTREQKEKGYQRVMPRHSWNSDHVVGRIMLFELSRHSDHHYLASRKYQILRHMEDSPQMPTGYPGMMLLALVPPLWYNVMHNRLTTEHQPA